MRCPRIEAGKGRCREQLELEVEPADDSRPYPVFSLSCRIHGPAGRREKTVGVRQ
jgi:hypothetical protein